MPSLRSKLWDVWYSLLLVGAGAALAGLAATTVALRLVGMPSEQGPPRKVYRLTAEGGSALLDWVAD